MIYSELAENTVIGALMQVSSPAEWLAGLCEEDFVQELNRAALSAMHRLCARREPIDIRTVGYEMRRDERAKDEGKAQAHLIGCFRACPAPSGVQGYVKRIKELSARRTLQRVAERLSASAADEGLPPDETAEEAMAELRRVGRSKVTWQEMSAMVGMTMDDVEKLAGGGGTVTPTGIADLDAAMGGFFPGELTVLGARPGVGKSALAAYMGVQIAAKGKKVAVCSLEMSPIQYVKRLIAAQSGVDGRKLRTGRGLTETDWTAMSDACAELAGYSMPFTFSVTTVEDLAAAARRRKDARGLDLLVVDYLQLLKVKRACESDYVRITTVSHELKAIALELEVPVLALAQVSRPETKGRLRMPTLDSLRGSGDIEQDADNVLLLHRVESVRDEEVPERDRATVAAFLDRGDMQYIRANLAKQRNGTPVGFGMAFDPRHMTYACIAR